MNKSTIYSAIIAATAIATMPTSATADIVTGLNSDDGVGTCLLGGTYPAGCTYGLKTVASGSWFAMDDGNEIVEPAEMTPIDVVGPLNFTDLTPATGSHAGAINGSENPVSDIWSYFGGVGMDYLTSPIVDNGDGTLDMSGWTVTWNGIPVIPMGGDTANFASDTGLATINCGACNDGDAFTLDYAAHVPLGDASGFGGVLYSLHLEGTVSTVPVPAAVWLFGSGLLGLVGVARRKSRV